MASLFLSKALREAKAIAEAVFLPTGSNMVTRTPLHLELIPDNNQHNYVEFGNYKQDRWIVEKTFNEKTYQNKLFGFYKVESDPFFSVLARNNKSNN